jgi:DNA-binding SARP family transcriptional activator
MRQWPWAFEVTSLGSFALRRGGEPIEFSAKGPGRPVELLKLLVSLGASQVRVETLADTLWPHVDADYAHQSFTATLHRLRRILGGEDTLKLRDGRLSLNGSLFWLDLWAIDEVVAAIDSALRPAEARAADETLRELLEEATSLYRGPFLADEAEHPGYIARREQLRGKLLRAVARAARHLEGGGRGDVALDAYQRLIDADEQCEPFYRNLMLCQQRLGDDREALATYERLCSVLSARSRSEPSAETRAIRAGLVA